MKKLSIFLAFVMLFTMIPMGALAADETVESYAVARDSITFDSIKGSNVSHFDISSALVLPSTATGNEDTQHRVVWTSSNPNVISNDGQTITRGAVDQWVTMTAKVYHEDVENQVNTYAERNISMRVLADESKVNMLFEDDFEDYTTGSELTQTAASDANPWYVELTGTATAYTDGNTTFTYPDDDITVTGNALKMLAKDAGKNLFATANIAGVPDSGLVSYSMDVLSAGSSTLMVIWPLWHTKTYDNINYPVGSGHTAAYRFAKDTWYNVTTYFDLDTNAVDTYINGVWAFGCTDKDVSNSLSKIQVRLSESYPNDYTYIDNIEVKVLLEDEKAALSAWNPATKGGIYVDKNLATTVTLNGVSYPVTYESSDTSVIAADGTVKLSDFFRMITVTPKVTIGGTEIKGTPRLLTVLPYSDNYAVRLDEDFDSLTNVAAGDFFNTDGSSKYTGWTQNRTSSDYGTAVAAGNTTKLVKDGDNYVLHMINKANSSDYRLTKSAVDTACGDRVALSMRVKKVSGNMNLSSYYMGRLRSGDLRGDFAGVTNNDDVKMSYTGDWQSYLVIFDKAISMNRGETTTVIYPISVYVDGVYKGTSWGSMTGYEADKFQLMQWGAVGTGEVYVDDILLMNFDSEDVQFAGATVANGTLTNVELQYASYGQAPISGTIMAAAYNASGALLEVSKLSETATATVAGISNTPVSYKLPEDAASYRLFFFDSISGLKPQAVSKVYPVE